MINMIIPATRRLSVSRATRGLSIVEVLVLIAVLVSLVGFTIPILDVSLCDGQKLASMDNLRDLNTAHGQYAADWNDRQFTLVRDDLGLAGGVCEVYLAGFGCHPPIIAGADCDGNDLGFFFCDVPGASCNGFDLVKPINFNGQFEGVGSFRLPNVRGFHEYVNGRFFDPVFYAPKDLPAYDEVAPLFEIDCEYAAEPGSGLFFSASYVTSPAAMFHPDVFAADGFQLPETLDDGYESPTVSQATYAAQKTRMLEHHWLQNPGEPCNPNLGEPCQPYYFNLGFKSNPMTLFYDGHVRGLSTREAQASDRRQVAQTGLGLWSRDTPFGNNGYFEDVAYDFLTDTSYHILTSDGIHGRDTLR